MIPNITHGSGFRGLLQYLLQAPGSEAPRPHARCIGGTLRGATVGQLCQEFGLVRRLRPNAEKVVMHHSLSYPETENPTDEQMRRDADRYLAHMGLQNMPYTIVVHGDKEHVHCHIVISKIGFEREWFDARLDMPKAQVAAACVEREFGLAAPPREFKQKAIEKKWLEIQKEQPEVKAAPLNPAPAMDEEGVKTELRKRIQSVPGGLPLDRWVYALELEGVQVRPSIGGTTISGWTAQLSGTSSKPISMSKVHQKLGWKTLLAAGGVVYDQDKHFAFAKSLQGKAYDKPTFAEAAIAATGPARDPLTLDWNWQPHEPVPELRGQDLVADLVDGSFRPHAGRRQIGNPHPANPRPGQGREAVPGLGPDRPTFPDVAARIRELAASLPAVPPGVGTSDPTGPEQHLGGGQPKFGSGAGPHPHPGVPSTDAGSVRGLPPRRQEIPGPGEHQDVPDLPAGGLPAVACGSGGGSPGSRGSGSSPDRGGLETVEVYWQVDNQDLQAAAGRAPAILGLWPAMASEEPKVQVAAAIILGERGLGLDLSPRRQEHVHAEALCRGFLWDSSARLLLPADSYREAREQIHGRPLEDFDWDEGRSLPSIWIRDRQVTYAQAIQEAVEVARPREALQAPDQANFAALTKELAEEEPEKPSYNKKLQRITDGWTPSRENEADAFRRRQEAQKLPITPLSPPPAATFGEPSPEPKRKRTHPFKIRKQ